MADTAESTPPEIPTTTGVFGLDCIACMRLIAFLILLYSTLFTVLSQCAAAAATMKWISHMYSEHIKVPANGSAITTNADMSLNVPSKPIIPYIEGDGIGMDITPAMKLVVEAAVNKAYGKEREIAWLEVFAGEKANNTYGEWLPEETLQVLRDYKVAIKGPLMTPVGGGFRSLNVSIRQHLDLYVCQRPIRYFEGSPSPLKEPWKTDMVIFRENSEGIYAGIEWEAGTVEADQLISYLQTELKANQIRFPKNCGIGVKVASEEASKRLITKAIQYAIDSHRDSVTIVHKGNIMKFTEGAFREWGYQVARDAFGATPLDGGPWHTLINPQTKKPIIVKDIIADAFLQQILLRPEDFSVVATMNLNGDYISDALAAHVGGIGIAPGANMGDEVAIFEATHGTAPGYAGLNKVNPSSLILSAEMMLRHLGWVEAADLILKAVKYAILSKQVTYDFARLMEGADLKTCSAYAQVIVDSM